MNLNIQNQLFSKKYQENSDDLQELYLRVHRLLNKPNDSWYPSALGEKQIKLLINSLIHKSQDQVLDVGCGIGGSSLYFLNKVKHINALDISKTGLIKYLKMISPLKGRTNVSITCSNFFKYKTNERYQIVIMQTFLEHVESLEEARAAVNIADKLTTPDGRLFIYTVNKSNIMRLLFRKLFPEILKRKLKQMGHSRELFYSQTEFEKIFQNTGFRKLSYYYIYPPFTSMYDFIVFPQLIKLYLKIKDGVKAQKIFKFIYQFLIYPLGKLFSIFDYPFILLRSTSGIIVIAYK